MEKIYILKKHKLLFGPYTLSIVKEKGLKQTDLVWYEGLTDWTPVTSIIDLQDCIKGENHKVTERSLFQKMFAFLK